MSESFTPDPNMLRRNHATRVLADKLAADALNLRTIRTASVLSYTSESAQAAQSEDES